MSTDATLAAATTYAASSSSPPQPQPPQRRLSRRTHRPPPPRVPILEFQRPWTQHYIDIGHCRLHKCTVRVQNATPRELERFTISFLAMAITASTAYGPKAKQERALIAYARAVMARNVPLNDQDDSRRSAVAAATYYGYADLLKLLLIETNCTVTEGEPHALLAAVSNGQHDCMKLLFDHRSNEICALLHSESIRHFSKIPHSSYWGPKKVSTLYKAISRKDLDAVRLLREQSDVMLSDWDLWRRPDTHKKLEWVLQELYPHTNIQHWRKELHWSFPLTDRHVLNWMWHSLKQDNDHQLPTEVWLRVFGFVGRFWWAIQEPQK